MKKSALMKNAAEADRRVRALSPAKQEMLTRIVHGPFHHVRQYEKDECPICCEQERAMPSEGKQIHRAAGEIWDILEALPSPRSAAKALAAAHLRLIEEAGAPTKDAVKAMLQESSDAVLGAWSRERQ